MSQSLNIALVIAPAWIGDTVMSQSLLMLLKAQFDFIDVLAPAWAHPLLERMPEVHQTFKMPLTHGQLQLKTRWALAQTLKTQQYQQAFVLPNSWKSALIPYWAKIPKRTGWHGEMRYGFLNDRRRLDKEHYPLMVERFLALGLASSEPLQKPYPLPKLTIQQNAQQQALKTYLPEYDAEKPLLALCPGAQYGPAKQWPARHFATVARKKLAEGWQIGLFGSLHDQAICAEIQLHSDHACFDVSGKTNLGEAVDLLALAHAVISNDSGLMHIAAALDKQVIALYGSSTADFTPPLHSDAKIMSLNLPCSPCFKRTCPLQHLNCLNDLEPEKILEAMVS